MRVRVKNQFSLNHGRVGIADEAAWDRDDFWIQVSFGNSINMIAKRDLREV